MNEIIIAAISLMGGGVIKGYYDHAIAAKNVRAKQIESEADLSAEFYRIGADRDQKSLDRLTKRIEGLESRLDSHDRDCDQKIEAALRKQDKMYEQKMKLIQNELNHRIDEISETSFAKQG